MEDMTTDRTLTLQGVQLDLERTLLALQRQHARSLVECCHILAQLLVLWTQHALRTRQH